MLIKLEKPVMIIPDIYAKCNNRYNEKLFNFLSSKLDELEKEAHRYSNYTSTSKAYREEMRNVPWFLIDSNDTKANSYIGLDDTSLDKEGTELDMKNLDIDFYGNLNYKYATELNSDKMGVSHTDLKNITDIDKYLKHMLGIYNVLCPWYSVRNNNTIETTKQAKNIVDLLHLYEKSDFNYDNKLNIADIVLSNKDKPYEFVPKGNILFVIAKTGFTNLLKDYLDSFSILLYSDIVREYRSAFGVEELESSLLFSKYLLKQEHTFK